MTSIIEHTLTVTELTQSIKNQLESSFSSLAIKGEVTNLRKQASGHYYFSLKDENAQISAVLFKGNARYATYLPQMGDKVLVKGELTIYAPRGTYQIIVREIKEAGVGELLLRFYELKKKLEKKGWFHPDSKKKIPRYPKTIGVVTSPTGSVIQDILNVLKRRYPNFHLILNPVKVQGKGASQEIAQAIEDFNRLDLVDILIIARGGGSLEDLWAFNEECVAKAIFQSNIPIVSAIGHETDVTIADFVADIRAPTPSTAAELSVKELHLQLHFLQETGNQSTSFLKRAIKHKKMKLTTFQNHPLLTSPDRLLASSYQKIDGIQESLNRQIDQTLKERSLKTYALKKQLQGLSPHARIDRLKEKMTSYEKALKKQILCQIKSKKDLLRSKQLTTYLERDLLKKLNERKTLIEQMRAHLKSIHPKNLLKKGYCIPFSEKDHSVIMSTHALKQGDQIFLHLHDGILKSTIDEVTPTHE